MAVASVVHDHRIETGRVILDDLLKSMIVIMGDLKRVAPHYPDMRDDLINNMVANANFRILLARQIHEVKRDIGLPVGDKEREAVVVREAVEFAIGIGLSKEDGKYVAEFALRTAMYGRDPRWPAVQPEVELDIRKEVLKMESKMAMRE